MTSHTNNFSLSTLLVIGGGIVVIGIVSTTAQLSEGREEEHPYAFVKSKERNLNEWTNSGRRIQLL